MTLILIQTLAKLNETLTKEEMQAHYKAIVQTLRDN